MADSLRLIFRPGFSTAAALSRTSGRGVGLDAVETAVEETGGHIRVASDSGRGSTFEIRLPVTFGLLEVLIVSHGDRKYLLDHTRIVFRQPIDTTDIEINERIRRAKVDGELLPLLAMSELLGQDTPELEKNRQVGVAVVQMATEGSDERVGILVETLGEVEKVLVRNLGSRGSRWFGVAGAAELRDGTVALLLDLPRLISSLRSARP
jgi:two-component system chemotaxis sensor kinase CheA